MNRIALLFEVLLLTVGIAFNGHAQTDAAIPEAPHWQVLLQQATDLFGQWKEQEAIELCQKVLRSEPPLAAKAEAHGVLADIYLSLGQFDAAAAEAQAALAMQSISEEARAELVARIEEIRQTRAEFGRRRSSHRAILGSRPAPEEAARVRYELAFTYLLYGWREEAKREAEGLIGAYPASEWASKAAGRMAVFCGIVGDAEQAEHYYDQVVRSYIAQGNPMRAVRLIQRRYLRQRDPEGAIAALEELISTYPGTETAAAALLGVAQLHERYGRLNLAMRAYERVVTKYPRTLAALEAQGRIAWQHYMDGIEAFARQDYPRAVLHLAQVRADGLQQQERFAALMMLGQIHEELAQYDEAIDAYWEAVDLFPDMPQTPDAQFQIGECLRKQGRYEEAIAEYRHLLERWPDTSLMVHIRDRIARCEQAMSDRAQGARGP